MPRKSSSKPWKAYGRYGSIGIELVLSIILGYYGGHWLDQKFFGDKGYVTGIGFLIGVYAGFRSLFAVAKKMQRDIEEEEMKERGEDPWKRKSPDTNSRANDDDHDK